jgi:hypothetical protein
MEMSEEKAAERADRLDREAHNAIPEFCLEEAVGRLRENFDERASSAITH